jgi:uncharacterized protein (TIGR03067 family)
MKWVIDGDTITLTLERGQEEHMKVKRPAEKREGKGGKDSKPSNKGRGLQMTFRLDATKSPRQIDIDGPKKSLSLGLYQLDGDELTVCMGATQPSPSYDKQAKRVNGSRPTAIGPEAGTVIMLRRVRE